MSDKKEVSLAQENKIAKLVNGSRTPRSGGGPFALGDVTTGDWLFECKTTVEPKASYSVQLSILEKMDHERAEMRKPYAALTFELGENRDDFFVLSRRTMKAVIAMQEGIRELIRALQKEIATLDDKFKKLSTGISTPTQRDKDLYQAHRQEKMTQIASLEKLI